MTRPRSLGRDLALGLGAGLAVLWILAMLGTSIILREELDEIYDSLMEQTADRLDPLMRPDQASRAPPATEVLLSWVLRDPAGRIVRRSDHANAADFARPPPAGFSTQGDQRHFVRDAGGFSLDVASPLRERREAFRGIMGALLLPALLLLPLAMLGVWWFARARLRPVAALSAQVAGRHPDDLRPLGGDDLQSEILPLRDAMNRLMHSLDGALQAERAFSGNAAHELRTPIAASLAQVQRLVADAPPGPLLDRARQVEAQLKRVARLVDKILQLARAEGAAPVAAPVDLVPIMTLVALDFGLRPDMPDAPVAVAIDPDAFAMLARNLIENAVTHGHDVRVHLAADGRLTVTNRGPVVPARMLPRLAQRFERAGAQVQGSGLGLAIVAAILRKVGGRMQMVSPAPGQADGFCCVVEFAPPDAGSGPDA